LRIRDAGVLWDNEVIIFSPIQSHWSNNAGHVVARGVRLAIFFLIGGRRCVVELTEVCLGIHLSKMDQGFGRNVIQNFLESSQPKYSSLADDQNQRVEKWRWSNQRMPPSSVNRKHPMDQPSFATVSVGLLFPR